MREKKATLLDKNAPLHVDPIALAAGAGPKLNSTQQLHRFFLDAKGFRGRERELEDCSFGVGEPLSDAAAVEL